MRTLLLVDNKSKGKESRLLAAIDRIKADYGGDFTYQIQYRDYDTAPWIYYDTAAKGLAFSFVSDVTKNLFKDHNLEFDNIMFIVDETNWQNGTVSIGGWNLGGKMNNYYCQIIRFLDSDEWLYKAFAMEIMHQWDDMAWAELTMNLNTLCGMDWDYDVIHGENPKWGKYVKGTNQEKWTKTDYYTDYNFAPVIQEFGSYFKLALDKRKRDFDKFIAGLKQQISLLEKIIELIKIIRQLQKPKATALTMGELTGEGEPHHHHH